VKSFCGFRQKVFANVRSIYPGRILRAVAVSAPAKFLKRVNVSGRDRAGVRRNDVARHAKRRCPLQPGSLIAGVQKATVTARQRGATGTVAASRLLRQWMETLRAETALLTLCAA